MVKVYPDPFQKLACSFAHVARFQNFVGVEFQDVRVIQNQCCGVEHNCPATRC